MKNQNLDMPCIAYNGKIYKGHSQWKAGQYTHDTLSSQYGLDEKIFVYGWLNGNCLYWLDWIEVESRFMYIFNTKPEEYKKIRYKYKKQFKLVENKKG